jgi:tetratricopeptide (TPR) repeat protein
MAIRGSLSEASLPDVVQLLTMGRKTGCLSVSHRQSFGAIYFERGRITYATLVNRRDRIGDLLLKARLITPLALQNAVDRQNRERDKRLGRILVEQESLSQAELERIVRVQIEEAIYHLFTWPEGAFNFEPEVFPEEDLKVSINPEAVLLEGARRVDEWSLIEKRIPSLDLVFDIDRHKVEDSDVTLTPEQERLLGLMDGRRDVTALIDETGLGQFTVGKVLFGLLSAGFLKRVGRTHAPPAAGQSKSEEHRNLGIAFYRTGMLDEALREFKRVIELSPSDAVASYFLGLVLLRRGMWADAASSFARQIAQGAASPTVYHNLALALEHSGKPEDARAALHEAIQRGGNDPLTHVSIAALDLAAGRVSAADASLATAHDLWGDRPRSVVWFHVSALAAAARGQTARAVELLAEGIAAHPRSAVLYNNLAAVQERRGKHAEARDAVDHGLQEDPTVPQLHKNLGDQRYRSMQYDHALEAYQRAVKLNPALGVDVYLKLGNIRFRRHEREDAIRCWERALALDPQHAIVRTNLDAARRLA